MIPMVSNAAVSSVFAGISATNNLADANHAVNQHAFIQRWHFTSTITFVSIIPSEGLYFQLFNKCKCKPAKPALNTWFY